MLVVSSCQNWNQCNAMECLTWIFLSSEFACFVAGEIIQVIEAMPGSVVPLAMFWCLFCILGYSKHFIFHENFHFFGWDWGILGSNNLMNWWDINPPFMYCVFHHISDHLQRLILFWQFYKKVGLRSDPPPWLVQKTKFVKGKKFWGSPECFD